MKKTERPPLPHYETGWHPDSIDMFGRKPDHPKWNRYDGLITYGVYGLLVLAGIIAVVLKYIKNQNI